MTAIVLDGATATELERAGLAPPSPLGSAAALLSEPGRRALRGIHAAYREAGAGIVTANTLRCNARTARAAGLDRAGGAWLVHAAVGVARAAVGDAAVAGSIGPVEDCYRPDLVPPDDELRAEHGWLATELVRAGVDLVLVETMNTGREAAIAVEAVRDAGGRAWASFACGAGGRLLSGEPLSEAAGAVEAAGAEAVLVNCTPPAETETALRSLRDATGVPIGAYPNAEARGGPAVGPHELAEALGRWHEELDLRIVGGCCGTTPAHIAAVAARLALSRPRAAAGS